MKGRLGEESYRERESQREGFREREKQRERGKRQRDRAIG